jgi:D-inositol-3-phosphate glycosyltransferase
VVAPGVDLETFSPGSKEISRNQLGLKNDQIVLLFVGRVQPLKAPDLLIKATAQLIAEHPELRDQLSVVICGGPSGTGLEHPESLSELANELGVAQVVRFEPPADRGRLVDWYRSADLCVVPSYSESFGLVAVEAQACGTPVLAARVGGLPTAVAHNASGVLVDGHETKTWANEIYSLISQPERLAKLSDGAIAHAAQFSWDATTDRLIEVYDEAVQANRMAANES